MKLNQKGVLLIFVSLLMVLTGCATKEKAVNLSKADLQTNFFALQDSYITTIYDPASKDFREPDALKKEAKVQIKKVKKIKQILVTNTSRKKVTEDLIEITNLSMKLYQAIIDDKQASYNAQTAKLMTKINQVSQDDFSGKVSKSFALA